LSIETYGQLSIGVAGHGRNFMEHFRGQRHGTIRLWSSMLLLKFENDGITAAHVSVLAVHYDAAAWATIWDHVKQLDYYLGNRARG
jgi:hypothetical protein